MINLLPLIFLLNTFSPSRITTDLQVNLIFKEKGDLHLAVYNNTDDFLSQEVALISEVLGDSISTVNLDIPLGSGNIAIAAFQDVNGNGEFDINLFGIPKEPYAISNDLKAKWREPTFDEAKIDITENFIITLDFDYWKNR